MLLEPPTAPLPEPFATLRRRHPDVDVVLLPGGAAARPAEPGEEAGEAEVAELLVRVRDVAGRLEEALDLGEPSPPRSGIDFGTVVGTVVVRSRAGGIAAGSSGVLERLAGLLERLGWQVRRLGGPVDRLVADRDDLQVRASYSPGSGAFLREVVSRPVVVGSERARALVGS